MASDSCRSWRSRRLQNPAKLDGEDGFAGTRAPGFLAANWLFLAANWLFLAANWRQRRRAAHRRTLEIPVFLMLPAFGTACALASRCSRDDRWAVQQISERKVKQAWSR